MAVANQLSAVVPKLLAQGLLALRENAIMPRLVNLGYSEMAGEKGSTIEVPIPSAITAQAVTSAATAPDSGDMLPTSISIPLDQWFEASFTLSDKELLEVQSGTIPMQASEAVRALANKVDNYIFDLWYKIPYIVVAPGADPFNPSTFSASDARTLGMTDVTRAMTMLNKTLAPTGERRFVVDPVAYGNLMQVRGFNDFSSSNSLSEIIEGKLSRKFGFDWFMSQNLPRSHVAGAGFGGTTDQAANVTAATAAGVSAVTVTMAGAETLDLKKGDVITFSATDAGYYTVTADVSIGTGANGSVGIYPNLRVPLTTTPVQHTLTKAVQPISSNAVSGTDSVALAFHRDAFAFASRPLSATDMGLGVPPASAVDPVSGLSLRLEVTREYKRTRFSYDILFGAQLIRPEFAVRYQYGS